MKFKHIVAIATFAFAAQVAMAQMNLPKTVVKGTEYYYYDAGERESIYGIAAKLNVTNLVGGLMNNPRLSKKLGPNMTKGMLMPYENVLKKVK